MSDRLLPGDLIMVPYGTVGWKRARARKEINLGDPAIAHPQSSVEVYIAPLDLKFTLGIFIAKDDEIKPPEVLCLFNKWGLCWVAANRIRRC